MFDVCACLADDTRLLESVLRTLRRNGTDICRRRDHLKSACVCTRALRRGTWHPASVVFQSVFSLLENRPQPDIIFSDALVCVYTRIFNHMSIIIQRSPTTSFPHPLVNVKQSNAESGVTNYLSYALAELLTWQGYVFVVLRF